MSWKDKKVSGQGREWWNSDFRGCMDSVGSQNWEKGDWVRLSMFGGSRGCLETKKPGCMSLRYLLKTPRMIAGLRVVRKEKSGFEYRRK